MRCFHFELFSLEWSVSCQLQIGLLFLLEKLQQSFVAKVFCVLSANLWQGTKQCLTVNDGTLGLWVYQIQRSESAFMHKHDLQGKCITIFLKRLLTKLTYDSSSSLCFLVVLRMRKALYGLPVLCCLLNWNMERLNQQIEFIRKWVNLRYSIIFFHLWTMVLPKTLQCFYHGLCSGITMVSYLRW